ncbi:hypothetical protein [Crenobacter intestini]|uniref:Uncharacterized protein n=1 Tax=Crenobacter intestini TaxID=2563443 RepID=A0A4T0UNP4_9NEIS|nr:hypothetical protein [Crenobacter intestini]TIC80338.1 hypothetical protein E5K04_12610 [Crenobacter intestini]
MKQTVFLQQSVEFTDWLARILTGQHKLDFPHQGGVYHSLQEALAAYAWPNKRTDIPTPEGLISLPANADFAANEAVLDKLENGLHTALAAGNQDLLADWMRAVFIWGGVYTRTAGGKGNAGWLDTMRPQLTVYLGKALQALGAADDESICRLDHLRSNAGTTKVHSLLLPDFVIYDSRVAAALAWLVWRWSQEQGYAMPEALRFACMAPKSRKLCRTPDSRQMPYFAASGAVRQHHKHAQWNLRANWLVAEVLAKAKRQRPGFSWRSRELEAALFVMGYDLTAALKRQPAAPLCEVA